MSNNGSTRDYVNSFFGKITWPKTNLPSFMVRAGVKKVEFIAWLNTQPATQDGFINFTIGTQKQDPAKVSAWTDDYQGGSRNASPQTNSQQVYNEDDSGLPF